jgi:prepilin-type N-terminal cleavage/methylation domain-containing protein
MKILNKKQGGFTLVELVVVVAVIGVLAVIAAPKIVGVATDARKASLTAVASTMTAAMARNYAAREGDASQGSPVAYCGDVATLMDSGKLPVGYQFSDYADTSNSGPHANGASAANVDSEDSSISIGNGVQVACFISTTNNPILSHIFYGIGATPN